MNKFDKRSDKGELEPEGGDGGLDQVVLSSASVIHPGNASLEANLKNSEVTSAFSAPSLEVSGSRRVWLRRGIAVASPVVASLVSAPVYGACLNLNPSGFVSRDTFNSRHPGQTVCTFRGPNFWLSEPTSSWPTGTANKKFEVVFGGANVERAIVDAKPSPTLSEVLNGGRKYSDLAKYSVAAYLNVLKPTTDFPFTEQQVKDIYNSYYPGPVKTPPLVAGWSETQTIAWLAMLMP